MSHLNTKIDPNLDSILQSETSNLGVYKLTKDICARVEKILDKIKEVSLKTKVRNSQIEADNKRLEDTKSVIPKAKKIPAIELNETSENLIKFSMDRALIRGFVLDKMFSPAYSDSSLDFKWEDMLSYVIYNKDNKHIEHTNEAYREATGLSSIPEIKALSKSKQLYEKIYEGETLKKVLDSHKKLNNGGYPAGYTKDFPIIHTDNITNEKSEKIIRWNTRKNVRIGIDVTNIKDHKKILPCLDTGIDSSFSYNEIINLFNIQLNQIIDSIPGLGNSLDISGNTKRLELIFEELKNHSSIGDIIINFGPLPVFFQHDVEMFLNKRYVEMSGYDYSELLAFMNSGELGDKLFGLEKYKSLISRIDKLQVGTNLNEILTITRKGGATINVLWNIHRFKDPDPKKYDDKGSLVWTGIIVSPINQDGEEVEDEGIKGESYFNFEEEIDDLVIEEEVKDIYDFLK